MAETFDLVIRGGRVMTPSGQAETSVGVRDGRIAAIGDLAESSAGEVFEADGLTVLPGVIDTQVHFREPGNEHKEDLAHGSRAAVAGGVTAVFEMPNTKPATVTADALNDKLKRAEGMWCDHAFFIGAALDNHDDLAELEQLPGCCGVKLFMGSSTGGLLVDEDTAIASVLAHGRRRVAIHAEDEPRLVERKHLAEEEGHARAHPVWRDVETALRATKRIVALAREANRPVHVLHITTAEEIAFLGTVKDVATVECLPQHLTLTAPDCYERLGGYAQMNPPIREARHQAGLWAGINQGIVDVLGSDHAPHTKEEKEQTYPASPSGMPGVQTILPLMLNHVAEGRLTLERVIDLLCYGPQRIYNIRGKGRIAVGYDADFTLVDLKAKRTINAADQHTKSGWTPFDGMDVTGWPMATIIRGHTAMRDGKLAAEAGGKPVRFWDTPEK
ncbi:MAG: dihydroorotase [Rhodospirillaceae bacterium]|nr:dihydroorotase [Rhodospirillaceae bacterium]MBT6202202.1 dihydroorotase [Rhodospirillaceae bacterium]MBT7647505.1 dihydroorotase [Rhodospirillaceae bacterium]